MAENSRTQTISVSLAACTIVACGLFYASFARSKTANASPAPQLLSALPAGAPTLIYLDLAAVRGSSFYQHRPDKEPIAIPNPDYADFVRSTGFDFEKDLDRVVIASWPVTSAKELKKSIVIAEGRFDRAKISDYASRKGKLDHQQGHDVFLFSGGDRMGMESVTFLDDHRIALVSGPSVASLFAPHSNDSAADPARERAARLDGAAAFMITPAPPIPDKPAGAGSQEAGAAQLLSLVRAVHWITLAARPEGDNLRVSLEGECGSSSDAQQLKSALELLRMFGSAGLQDPKTTQSMNPAGVAMLKTLLTSAEVTQSAERVRILVELTPEIFKLSDTRKPQ